MDSVDVTKEIPSAYAHGLTCSVGLTVIRNQGHKLCSCGASYLLVIRGRLLHLPGLHGLKYLNQLDQS